MSHNHPFSGIVGCVVRCDPTAHCFVTNVDSTGAQNLAQPVIADVSGLQSALNAKMTSITLGTVTTLSAGSSASISFTGGSTSPTINFYIPKGDTGSGGSVGATGATGAAGPAALVGSTTVSMSLLSLGAVYSTDTTIAGATTSMVAVVNFPSGLIDSISFYECFVVSANTVRLRFKVAIAIGAATRTFLFRVLQ